MDGFIAGAEAALQASGEVLRAAFRGELQSDMKPDNTIVTEADAAAEKAMRAVLTARFPEHRVTGEEFPPEGPEGARYEWVLDPIDGTIAFACGKPTFTTLAALLEDGVPVLGVIDQPVSGERWLGAKGRPTTFNGAPSRTSGVSVLSEARFGTTDPALFPAEHAALFETLRDGARVVSYGGDAYQYGLLASGHLDLIFESALSRHDIAALLPVVLGAGGAACDADGQDWTGRALQIGERFSIRAMANSSLGHEAV